MSKYQLDAMQGELAQHINAMARICAGMTLEEMQNATFTYKTLLEVMKRRDVRNACVPDEKRDACAVYGSDYEQGCIDGWNNCREEMIGKMGEQK